MACVRSRAPTKKIKATTGHGRSRGFGDVRASIGCLYVSDKLGVPEDQLKEELLKAARDEGLPFALRVAEPLAVQDYPGVAPDYIRCIVAGWPIVSP